MARRTAWKKNVASTVYNEYSGRKNLATDSKFLLHYPSTTRFNRNNLGSRQRIEFKDQTGLDETLSVLMSKVKHLHKRFHTKNNEINDDVYSEKFSSRLEKRRLILSKISRLESDISEML